MTETQNIFAPLPEGSEGFNDAQDPIVSSFVELQEKAANNTIRVDKLEDIEEDKEIMDELMNRLPTTLNPVAKPSLYFKVLRVYDVQADLLPSTKAVKERGSQFDINLVNSIKDEIYNDVGMQDVYQDIIRSFKTEGSAIVQIGFDDDGELIPVERCELAEIYFDPSVSYFASDSSQKGRVAKWIVREVLVQYSEFLELFPDSEGEITEGSPGMKETREVFEANFEAKIDLSTEIGIHYAYSITDPKNPVMIVYAGGNSRIVQPALEGKDYPYWRKRTNGKEYAFLPFVDFHYSTVKRGFYSISIIGMMKDLAEAYRKILNSALPIFQKTVNKILLLFGGGNEQLVGDPGVSGSTVEELQIAMEQQQLGMNPYVNLPESTRIDTLSPDPGIFQDFTLAKRAIFEEASDRFDINFLQLSTTEATATVFIGKTKTELQAISGLYKINRSGFNRLAEYTVALASKFWNKTDKRLISVAVDESGEDEVSVGVGEAVLSIREWSGSFETDVDLKMPLSTADKASALNELSAAFNNLFYAVPWTTVEEIEQDIDILVKRADLKEMGDLFSKPRMLAKARKVLESRQPPEPPQPEEVAELAGAEQNVDVRRELAPQTALKEAGIAGVV